MKRSSFIKSLAGVPALGLLSVKSIKQYEKVYLKQCFVRDSLITKIPPIIEEINQNGQIEMVREPEIQYDKRAIALYFNQKKIGYLQQENNKTLSTLTGAEMLEFHASDWGKIRVAVFALKEIKNSDDLKKIAIYTVLYTPKYYSIQSEENTLTRFEIQEEIAVKHKHL